MSKFNTKAKEAREKNYAGVEGYIRLSFESELLSVILNSMLSGDSFYESEADRLLKIEAYVAKNPQKVKFMAQAMVYARLEGNLRSISHYMAVLLSENVSGESYLRKAIYKILKRPDDATEIVSLWNQRNPDVSIPNPMRRAIRDALENKFDAYQLKKYFGSSNKVKVSDLIKLTRPAPKDAEQEKMFKDAIEGTLPKISTAQTINASQGEKSRAKMYQKLLKENALGYMAALKNLRNILESGISEKGFERLMELLVCEKAILGSGVLPFRFAQAYEILNEYRNDTEPMNTLNLEKVSKKDDFKVDSFALNRVKEALNIAFKLSAETLILLKMDRK